MWQNLKKFGVENCNLPTMFDQLSLFLRTLALNIDQRNKNKIPLLFVLWMVVASVCYCYVYLFSAFWFVFCRETEDVVVDMVILSLALTSIIGMVKLPYLHLYRKELKKLVSAYLACDSLICPSSRMANNLLKTLKIVKKRAIFFWIVTMNNGLIYIIMPFVRPGRHLMEDKQVIFGLEPMFESPNLEIARVLVSIAVLLSIISAANITGLLIVITGYSEAQMLALSEELTNLWNDAKCQNPSSINKHVKNQLIDIVKAHATNVKLIRMTERFYRNAFAVELTFLVMAVLAELLGGIENTYIQIPFTLIHVSMDCFAGQRLMEASETMRDAVYGCEWENFDASNMKTVLIILVNSNTMSLSAGGITKLNYASLMSVFKSIYSAYTTLRSTME